MPETMLTGPTLRSDTYIGFVKLDREQGRLASYTLWS